jgi:serine protease Do
MIAITTPLQGRSGRITLVASVLWLISIACTPLPGREQGNTAVLQQMSKAFASVAEKASPGVVAIVTKRKVAATLPRAGQTPFDEPSDPSSEDLFNFFFRRSPRDQRPQREYMQRAQGSGFVISKEGHILTNNHMVNGADEVMVELAQGRVVKAQIVGTDPESDVAVVRIDANNLSPVALGDSDTLEVGEWVLAIGNPMGLSHTITAGIVSATGRSGLNISTYENFIQTDAAINMGNSGGPLVNLDGQAVGINTAIVGPNGGNIGIGFAIPINMARDVADQLIRTGSVQRGYLEIYPQDLTPDLAEALGLKDTKGVVITQITEGSPAAEAGMQRDDVVLEFGGLPVESASQFRNLVAARKPGETVEMVVLRGGERGTLTAAMGKRPSAEELRSQQEPQRHSQEQSQHLGLVVQELTPELAEQYGLDNQAGVVITRVTPGSEAAEKGLRAGYVIREVNRQPVNSVAEFKDAVAAASAKGRALLLVTDGQTSQYVVLKVPQN